MEWIREPMEVNMTKSVSWCPCMGAKCRGNNPPFCSIKTSNCKKCTNRASETGTAESGGHDHWRGCGIIHFCRIYKIPYPLSWISVKVNSYQCKRKVWIFFYK